MNWEQLRQLPLFKPSKKILSRTKKCDYGFGRVVLKFGNECGGQQNYFSITLDGYDDFGGCCHKQIEKFWPEYAYLIKWHLVDTEGPIHYIANTIYHAKQGDIEAAKKSAVCLDEKVSLQELLSKEWLYYRLPDLMDEFAEGMNKLFNLS